MTRRRELSVFSLSFLDVMSCGFGAVILIFIIIDHASDTQVEQASAKLIAEVQVAEEEFQSRTGRLSKLNRSLEEAEQEATDTRTRAQQTRLTVQTLREQLDRVNGQLLREDDEAEALKSRLRQLERDTENLRASVETDPQGDKIRAFVSGGDRQYLTGLRVGGRHLLVLLDSSTSMLDTTLVNIIRRRNLPPEDQLQSPKWQRAIRVVEWIFANLPPDSHFQLFLFNDRTRPVSQELGGDWLATSDRASLDTIVERLKLEIPGGGTNLHDAFAALAAMRPRPDNVFLVIDSLPTRDASEPRRSVIESKDRVQLFNEALQQLPQGIPINIILLPMEGDPFAAPLLWQLAQWTGGSFMSPAEDWP